MLGTGDTAVMRTDFRATTVGVLKVYAEGDREYVEELVYDGLSEDRGWQVKRGSFLERWRGLTASSLGSAQAGGYDLCEYLACSVTLFDAQYRSCKGQMYVSHPRTGARCVFAETMMEGKSDEEKESTCRCAGEGV